MLLLGCNSKSYKVYRTDSKDEIKVGPFPKLSWVPTFAFWDDLLSSLRFLPCVLCRSHHEVLAGQSLAPVILTEGNYYFSTRVDLLEALSKTSVVRVVVKTLKTHISSLL
jgi:hypothetical protein